MRQPPETFISQGIGTLGGEEANFITHDLQNEGAQTYRYCQ